MTNPQKCVFNVLYIGSYSNQQVVRWTRLDAHCFIPVFQGRNWGGVVTAVTPLTLSDLKNGINKRHIFRDLNFCVKCPLLTKC